MIQRMPRLLDGAMQARERLNPVRANVQMNLTPLSTASLTLPPDDPEVSARDFVAVYAPDESYGVYRVTSIRTVYGDQRQVTLEEGICTLEDDLTAEDTVLNGDMQAVLETLLAFQTNKRWQLGTIASEAQFTDVEAARVNVLEAVLEAVAADDTVMLVRDYSHTPWVLNVVKKPEAVSCECRLNRNLNNVTATLDDSELCTRVTVVPDEGEAFEMDADTVNTWGVVHREITVEEGKDPEAEARKYLEAHKNPALSVECDALALAELTGEAWDSFSLGQLCAVALPDFGVVLRERIVTVYYSDLFADPRHVRLTLSTQAADASSALASLGAATKSNSKGLGRAFKHITETDNAVLINAEQIALQAEQIALRATKKELEEVDGKQTALWNEVSVELDATNAELRLKASQESLDETNLRLSEAEITLNGAEATITAHAERLDKLTGDLSEANLAIDGANARIDAEAKRIDEANGEISSAKLAIDGANAAITAEVKRASEAEGELTGKLEVTTEAITAEVTRATTEEGKLAGRIRITEDSITEQAGKIDAQGKLISGAQEDIDGLNKSITDVAGSVDTLTGTLSGVQTKLDGVEKTVTTQAGTIDAQGELIEGAQSQIDGINAKITDFATHTEVTDLGKTVNTVSETLDAVKGEVETKVSQTAFDALGKRMTNAESSITQNANEITSRVKKGEIASTINQTAQSVKIQASKIELSGYVTAEYLKANYMDVDELSSFVSGEIDLERINADSGSIMDLSCGTLLVGQIDMGTHYHTFTPNADGTVTIGGPSATAGSFKIADTQFYKDGVSAAKNQVRVSGSWSGGIYTARTDAPSPHSTSTYISGTATWAYNSANHSYTISAPVMWSGGPGTPSSSTGYTISGVTGTEAYDAGYAAGEKSGSGVTIDGIDRVEYLPDTKAYRFYVNLSNGTSHAYTISGVDAYNAGAASVYVTEDSNNIKWQTNIRRIGSIDGTVTVVLSNGNEYSRRVTSITAPSVTSAHSAGASRVALIYGNVTSGVTSSQTIDIT